MAGRKQTKFHLARRIAGMAGAPLPPPTAEAFWELVQKGPENECWPWLGATNGGNRYGRCKYGRIEIEGKNYFAHRIIYELTHPGAITWAAPRKRDEPGFIRHTCDNTMCCNPAHMLLGNHDDNMRDKVERGRSRWFTSSVESPRAKLSADNVRAIRLSLLRAKQIGIKLPSSELARKYGVSIGAIDGVRYGRHYKDII